MTCSFFMTTYGTIRWRVQFYINICVPVCFNFSIQPIVLNFLNSSPIWKQLLYLQLSCVILIQRFGAKGKLAGIAGAQHAPLPERGTRRRRSPTGTGVGRSRVRAHAHRWSWGSNAKTQVNLQGVREWHHLNVVVFLPRQRLIAEIVVTDKNILIRLGRHGYFVVAIYGDGRRPNPPQSAFTLPSVLHMSHAKI